jgi:hypothetical protein
MTSLAKQLPVMTWIKEQRGFGEGGLANVIAETGDLAKYANVAKVWKRLGYAPYDGYAGSTWKRPTWRPRALTAEEWTENPFSGQRYAAIQQQGESMFRHQWISAKKVGGEIGKPNGPYGEVYAERRARTKETHPDWTDGHAHADALRVMMKAFLRDLWANWNNKAARTALESDATLPPSEARIPTKPKLPLPRDNSTNSPNSAANLGMKPLSVLPPSEATTALKPTSVMPRTNLAANDRMKPGVSLPPSEATPAVNPERCMPRAHSTAIGHPKPAAVMPSNGAFSK